MKSRQRIQNRNTATTKQGAGYNSWKGKIEKHLINDHGWKDTEIKELFATSMNDVDWWWDARNDRGQTYGAVYSARNIDDQMDYQSRIQDHITAECGSQATASVTEQELRDEWLVNKTTDRVNNARQGAESIIKERGFPRTSRAGQQQDAEHLDKDGRQRSAPDQVLTPVGDLDKSVETPHPVSPESYNIERMKSARIRAASAKDPQLFMLETNKLDLANGLPTTFTDAQIEAFKPIDEADIPTEVGIDEEAALIAAGVTVTNLGSDDPDEKGNRRRKAKRRKQK